MINTPRWVLFLLQLFTVEFYKRFVNSLAESFAYGQVNKIQYGTDGVLLDSKKFFTKFEQRGELDLGLLIEQWAVKSLSAYKIGSKMWAVGAKSDVGDNVHEHNRFKFIGVRLFMKVHWFQAIPPCENPDTSIWRVKRAPYPSIPWIHLHASSTRNHDDSSLLPFVTEREFHATFMESNALGYDILKEHSPLSKMLVNAPAFLSLAELHNLYFHPEKFDGGVELDGIPSDFIKKLYNLPVSMLLG